MADKLVVGCGYLGRRVAEAWLRDGHRVWVTTRNADRAKNLAESGLFPLLVDVTEPERFPPLPEVATVLFAVGFDRAAQKPQHAVYVEGLQHILSALPASVARFIYISSTGVYGQATGDRVDEDTPALPLRDGGRACLAAEQLLQASAFGARSMILRLAGIYGPLRVPRSESIRGGDAIDAPADGYLNLIHVDDAVQIIQAVERLAPPRRYVVSDGQPCLRRDYYREIARLLDAPPPTFTAPTPDSPAAQRAASDKRIDPRRLFADIGVSLRYPSYREGLAAEVRLEARG